MSGNREATTVHEYLDSLPPGQRQEIETVRQLVLDNLPKGYEEGVGYGMIGYFIPRDRYPNTYNGQPLTYAMLAAQKNYCALHLMGSYGDPANAKRLKEGFARAGKKLDMGKACIRFRLADDLALDAVAEAVAAISVADYIALYERSRSMTKTGQRNAAPKKTKKKSL